MGAPPPPPYQAIISGKRSSRMSVHPSFLNFLNSGDTRTKAELVQENSIFSTKLLPVIFLSLYCLYNYVYVDNVEVFVFLLKISPKKRLKFVGKKFDKRLSRSSTLLQISARPFSREDVPLFEEIPYMYFTVKMCEHSR